MFEKIIAVRDAIGFTCTQKAALYALASRCDGQNKCWPKYETLQEDTGIGSRDTLSKALTELETQEVITRRRRRLPTGGVGTTYTLNVLKLERPKSGTPERPKSGTPERPKSGTPERPKSGTGRDHKRRDQEKIPREDTTLRGREKNVCESAKTAESQHARNPLMDALGECDGKVTELTRSAWARVAAALEQIKAVAPDVTPDEIRRRSTNYGTQMPDAILTSTALAKHWARCAEEGRTSARQKALRKQGQDAVAKWGKVQHIDINGTGTANGEAEPEWERLLRGGNAKAQQVAGG